jgi:signal peptidase I
MTAWLLLPVVLPVATAVVTLRSSYLTATVVGYSMSPTFADGEQVLVRRHCPCRVGDVVVFRAPERVAIPGDPKWRIKRVAAVAGDPIPNWLTGVDQSTGTVPTDRLVVVGDNADSQDSRHFGYIDTTNVAGVVARRTRRW